MARETWLSRMGLKVNMSHLLANSSSVLTLASFEANLAFLLVMPLVPLVVISLSVDMAIGGAMMLLSLIGH